MEKELIEVYVDPNLKRRIEEAAAKHNMPVVEYWLDAIEQKLAFEVVLSDAGVEIPERPKKQDDTLLDEMRELHERILARRGGKPLDIDIVELVRSERDDELTGMR